MAATAPAPQRWLYGPLPDLLLGCGVLYMALFAALSLYGAEIRAMQPAYLLPLLVILISMPHYGGTLVRVYESRGDRTQYALFSVYATIAVLAFFVWGLYSPFVGSLVLTLYFTWSPWHYTGQNYGIAVMFLRRRGVELPAGTKRLLYASFVLSYIVVALVFHTAEGRAVNYNLAAGQESIVFLPIGIPAPLASVLIPAVALGWLTATLAVWFRFREEPLGRLAPVWLLVLSQALWFTLPSGLAGLGWTSGLEPLDSYQIETYVIWIGLAHAAQYLWVTSYYAKSASSWRGQLPYLSKVAVAGIAVWTIPFLLFAPQRLGPLAYDGGLAVLIAAGVNLHHFVLDGAIWKLRHMRIGNVLIRSRPAENGLPSVEGRAWVQRTVWGLCGLSACIYLYAFAEIEVRFDRALDARNWHSGERTLDRIAWTGRDSANGRRALSQLAFESGDVPAAIRLYERSLALKPVAAHYGELATLLEFHGNVVSAASAYEAGLRLEPDNTVLLLGLARLELGRNAPRDAIAPLERLLELEPEHEAGRKALYRARRAAARAS